MTLESHQKGEIWMHDKKELRRAARDMVYGFKLSGMNNYDITVLVMCLIIELALDPDSSPELIDLLYSKFSNPPHAAPAR